MFLDMYLYINIHVYLSCNITTEMYDNRDNHQPKNPQPIPVPLQLALTSWVLRWRHLRTRLEEEDLLLEISWKQTLYHGKLRGDPPNATPKK